jgi:hypothetical protein
MAGMECRDPVGKAIAELGAQPFRPFDERGARRLAKPRALPGVEAVRQLEGRQPREEEDLVGVRVADAAQHARVGERALEGPILARERLVERRLRWR